MAESLGSASSVQAPASVQLGGTADVSSEITARSLVGSVFEVVMRTTHTEPSTLNGYYDFLDEAYGIEL